MFVLHDLPPPIDPALLTLLQSAEPATIGHFRHVGFMAPEIRLLTPGYVRIAGTAVTVRCYGADTTIVHYALGKLRAGDILVLDRAGDGRHAACGGGVAFAAKMAGCIGIIIDGPATDIQELREHGLPVWGRGLSAVTGKRLFGQGEFCVPVSCGGVAVLPGDAILADENGVLVMSAGEIEADARRALGMQKDEADRHPAIAAGGKLGALNGTDAGIAEIVAAQNKR